MKEKYIHSHTSLRDSRRHLRNNATPQEQKFWNYLKGKNLGFKFQRQHSLGNYIVDFYCASKKLIIELDGNQHDHNQEYDQERSFYLKDMGFNILRFKNTEIDTDIPLVLTIVKEELGILPLSKREGVPRRSRAGG